MYPVAHIHGMIREGGRPTRNFDGDKVKLSSKRYKTFYHKGTTCVVCGVEGAYYAKEIDKAQFARGSTKYHFNLYALGKNGNEMLMTIDHIHPKSKGGSDKLVNLQPMCRKCNCKKGNR